MLAASVNLWGSRGYAGVAAEILSFEARIASTNFMLRNGWSSLDPELLGDGWLSFDAMTARARKHWNDQCYPFSLQVQRLGNDNIRLMAGVTDRDHLAHYMDGRGLSEHTLHGSLGKAFDVLRVASGLAKGRSLHLQEAPVSAEEAASWRFSFMSRKQCLELIIGKDASPSACRERRLSFDDAVIEALHYQIKTGQPLAPGEEMITEGKLSIKGSNRAAPIDYDKIAFASLLRLGDIRSKDSVIGRRIRALRGDGGLLSTDPEK